VAHNVNFMACDDNGMQWIYSSRWGESFSFVHLICVCMQGVMIERVFYSVPHHLKYFHGDQKGDIETITLEKDPNNPAGHRQDLFPGTLEKDP
jgi:hypothetical protein